MDCGFVMPMLESGAVVIAPPETTRYNAGKQTFEFFRAGLGGKTGWYTPVWDNNALKAAGVTSRFLSEIIGWEFRSTETIGAVAGEFMGGGLFQSRRSTSPSQEQWIPWVVRNVGDLSERIRKGEADIFKDENGERECAQLPQRWDWKIQRLDPKPRQTPNWRMGATVTYKMPGVTWGTVMASFNRKTGSYESNPTGNHTLIFNDWVEESGWFSGKSYGMEVFEQGPYFAPRKRVIWFNSDSNYFNDAGKYNVVLICPQMTTQKPVTRNRR